MSDPVRPIDSRSEGYSKDDIFLFKIFNIVKEAHNRFRNIDIKIILIYTLFFGKYFKNYFIYFNWRLITVQYCGGFCHASTWISHGCTCVLLSWTTPTHISPHPITLGCPRALTLSALLHASNLHWSSMLCMVAYISSVQLLSCVRLFVNPWIAACQASLFITNSWRVIYMFQWYSLKSSHSWKILLN